MNKYFNAYIRLLFLCTMLIVPYGLLNGFYFSDMLTLEYVIVVAISLLCVLHSFEFGNNIYETIIPMTFIFAITQFHLVPAVFVSVFANLLNAFMRKYRTREAKRLLNIKSLFNFMSDAIGISLAFLMFQWIDIQFGQLLAIVFAGSTVALVNVLLIMIVMYLYSGTSTNVSFKMIGSHLTNNIGTSVILVYAYDAYGIVGLTFSGLFMVLFSTKLMFNTTKDSIEKEVYTDALTGAYNRGYLDKVLYDRLALNDEFALIFLDFDNFKNINDVYGHSVGDEVLKHFVSNVKSVIRSDEKIFRYGGDEFCILIDQAHAHAVGNMTERVNALNHLAMQQTDEVTIKYSFSMGQFCYTGEPSISLSDVYKNVSKRMTLNKKGILL